jgi:preprotein translocase subunit SecG
VDFFTNLLSVLIFLTSLFLILLILIQRGRGGGLIGALGGSGGSSAFGSRAGDTFTRVTLVAAGIWMLLIMIQIWLPKQVNNPAVGG